jgi:hypothetical protein
MLDVVQAKRESELERARKERAREEATRKARRLKRVEAEIVATLGTVRESWRRHEATPSTQPTPERASKALEIGNKVVAGKMVKTVKTTADLLQERRHLPRHLRGALDAFCSAVATAMSVCVTDGHGSSSKLIANYSGDAIGGGFGPREISDRVLNARFLWKTVEREMPAELLDVAEQLVAEETGLLQGRPAPLGRFGEQIGYTGEKQSSAAGTALAYAACAVLHHAIKRGIGDPGKQRVHDI